MRPGWANSAEDDLLALKHNPWVAGEFVWTGFDYIGEPTPYAWPSRSSYFGIVDLAGFPKDRYYLYKSQWTTTPMVHLLPMSWTWPGFEGKSIPVHVFTNAQSVELFLNGTSLGVRNNPADLAEQTQEHTDKDKKVTLVKSPGLHLEWQVPYAPGELKAVASNGGQVVATDIEKTAGAPAKLQLTVDRDHLTISGQDLAFITVRVLDKDGTVCPNADNEITYTLDGAAATIAGLDNGDATNHESFQGKQHKVYHGLGLAVLKSIRGATGPAILTATAEGLAPATATITVAP
jgi:beta-galactosidase